MHESIPYSLLFLMSNFEKNVSNITHVFVRFYIYMSYANVGNCDI